MKNTLINSEFLKTLLTSFQDLSLSYIALDQGQADEEQGKYKMMQYPSLLIQIEGEDVREKTHDLNQAQAEITLRLFLDCSLFANTLAPEQHITIVLKRYDLLESVITKGKNCGMKYQGFSEIRRGNSLTEFSIRFLLNGHLGV